MLVFAAATLADTVLSLDCAASADALCRYREATGSVSLGHRLHQVTSALTFGSALAAAARLERSTRRWHARVVISLLTVAFGLVLGARASFSAWANRRGRLQPGSGVAPDARQLGDQAGIRNTCVMAFREDVAAK